MPQKWEGKRGALALGDGLPGRGTPLCSEVSLPRHWCHSVTQMFQLLPYQTRRRKISVTHSVTYCHCDKSDSSDMGDKSDRGDRSNLSDRSDIHFYAPRPSVPIDSVTPFPHVHKVAIVRHSLAPLPDG